MQCIICEKPSAAKNYATALGGMSGTFNGKQYKIVNSVGHIFQLLNPEEQVSPENVDKYKSWNLDNLPWNYTDIKWIKKLNSEFKDTYKNIKDAVNQADEIVIATDDDPTGEGTLLADEILMDIKPVGKHYYRSFHTDESVKEIQKAMRNLTDLGTNPLKDPDYIKANFRSKWDFMSIQWTRIFTKYGDGKSVLRQGRLKSYIVWAAGEQIRKNNEYQKIPFYDNRFKDENENIFSSKNEQQYPNKSQVPNIYKPSDVVLDKEEIKHTAPPALYDLNMLSASLATKGFTAKQVLETYQKMYEDHVVSYPRTEDKTITPEQFNDFLAIADGVAKAVGVDVSHLTHRVPRKTHVVSQGSHGANRPASNVPSSLQEVKNKYGDCGALIYEFVARNSLAMLCEDYEYNHQSGHIKDYPDFKGYANVPRKAGYKAIFNDNQGEKPSKPLGKHAVPFIYEGFPQKPSWPTAKWLAELLKKNDVGTGATRASTLGEITNEKTKFPLLSQDKKGKLSMTPYGEMSYILLKDTHIGDVKLTEGLQAQMRDVSKGADPNKYINEIAGYIKDDIEIVKRNAAQIGQELRSSASNNADINIKCPLCEKPLKMAKNGVYCSGYKEGCKFGIYRTIAKKKLNDNQLIQIASGKTTNKISGFVSKSGTKFSAKLELKEGKVNFRFK